MEIDLNHAVSEVEKNVACNGDCEQEDCVCSLSSSALVSSYLELWHACAGPLTSLPKKGNVVVYFPQGHLEQVASFSSFSPREMPTYDLQPQIFCKVVNVQLLANKENDEVYTQVSLLPHPQLQSTNLEGKKLGEFGLDDEDAEGSPSKSSSTPHMFCKSLTASDTSTHGGFSVPRRAAEDCFPPLDYKLQRPSQELFAKDLHGIQWRFRHIYRGQPRRHLLTTGWSIFVSQKKLVSGDAVLFLRGESGELRLGIRRAVRPRNCLPESVVQNQFFYTGVLSSVPSAIANRSVFHVFYAPRASHAEFVVPYQKYIKSLSNPPIIGVRFKMRFENDESSEGRCRSGVVRGIGDLDLYRWPKSKWRCLMVRWDDDTSITHLERVSPWEIDMSGSSPSLSIQSSPRMKKPRTGLQPTTTQNLITACGRFTEFEDSVRSSKVLQGQENIGLLSPCSGVDTIDRQHKFETPSSTHQNVASTGMRKVTIEEFSRIHPSTFAGFAKTDRIRRVLQGQEIFPLRFLSESSKFNRGAWGKPNFGGATFNRHEAPQPAFQPSSSEILRSMFTSYGDIHKVSNQNVCSITNLQIENDLSNQTTYPAEIMRTEVAKSDHPDEQELQEEGSASSLGRNLRIPNKESFNVKMNGCRLFGISLTEDISNLQNPTRRSCTKVHKQGSLVGRAIDLSKLNGYWDLLIELERLFGMEGLLLSPDKGWRILYTDSENDIMVVGDDPWHEFCKVVSKIHIYTHEEVKKMTIGIISDDTHSCLEQSPVTMEASKSYSVGQTDSSPTVVRV